MKYLLYPWQTRAIRDLIFKELDRSGVLEIGDSEPAEAVSVAIGIPLNVVEAGLKPLLDDETLVYTGSSLLSPNFIDAQEASQSSKERQRKSRELRRDIKRAEAHRDVTKCDGSVTKRDETVTSGHTASHGVTPSQLNLTKPISIVDNPVDEPRFQDGVRISHKVKGKLTDSEIEVCKFYITVHRRKHTYLIGQKRLKALRGAMKDRDIVEIKKAIIGCRKSPFHFEKTNDRGEKYNDLELIFRDETKTDDFIRRYKRGDEKEYGENFDSAFTDASR